jgi:hypothetical protein
MRTPSARSSNGRTNSICLRYLYIDLALTDVERAISFIRDVLQAVKIAKRSWLQFFDDALASEWIGMWPDTPPPPGIAE